MVNKFTKMTTPKLQALALTAEGTDKTAIEDILAKRAGKEGKATKAAVKTEEKKAKQKKPKMGSTISFASRNGQQKIKGEVCRILIGKKDGKTYYGVKFKNKMYYKQEKHIDTVE